jgi:trehalose 6-phosphate synthase/phosphatase
MEYSYIKMGFGLNWQVYRSKKGFKELDLNILEAEYASSQRRFIMIDQESIIPFKSKTSGKYEPTDQILSALNKISKLPNTIIFIVSPESKKQMHDWYAKKCPNLGLAAENGFFWRWNSVDKGENDWT